MHNNMLYLTELHQYDQVHLTSFASQLPSAVVSPRPSAAPLWLSIPATRTRPRTRSCDTCSSRQWLHLSVPVGMRDSRDLRVSSG